MTYETYEKLMKIDYTRAKNQITEVLKKISPMKKNERVYKNERDFLDCDILGFASFILFLMIDDTINSFEDFEMTFARKISEVLNLQGVSMWQECINLYAEELNQKQRAELIIELRRLANSMDFDELVAYILFADITEEEDFACIKTPISISKLAGKLLDIKKGEYVADFSTGEKNFVSDIHFQNEEATYKFFNIGEEIFNVFYYLRYALLGIEVTNDIVCSMYDEEAEENLYDKVFQDYSKGIWDGNFSYPFDVAGINKEWKHAYRIMQLLKPEAKAVMIIPNICTTAPKDMSVRKWFVEKGYIEGVIALPEKMYKGTSMAFTMLLLSRGNEKINFIDATEKGQYFRDGAKRMKKLLEEDINELDDAIKGKVDVGRNVTLEDILNNESILNPIAYCISSDIQFKGIELQEVIRNITRGIQLGSNDMDQLISEESTYYKYLSPANIVEGVIQAGLLYLKKVEEKQKKYVANKNDLVISKNGEPFKIALVEEDNVLVSSNLYKIEIDERKINPLYLKGYLECENGQAELKKASSSGITTMLGIEALKKIQVPCLPLEEQEKIVKEYKILSENICKKQKEIEELSVMRKTLFG